MKTITITNASLHRNVHRYESSCTYSFTISLLFLLYLLMNVCTYRLYENATQAKEGEAADPETVRVSLWAIGAICKEIGVRDGAY